MNPLLLRRLLIGTLCVVVIVGLAIAAGWMSKSGRKTSLDSPATNTATGTATGTAADPTHSSESDKPGADGHLPQAKSDVANSVDAPTPMVEKSSEFGPALNVTEIKSVKTLIQSFFLSSQKDQPPSQLVRDLKGAGLKPVVAQNFNPETGKMLIIRTDDALPGTRYFHSQYFESEDKKPFVQHMSFEIRPGKDNMERAIAIVQEQFGKLQKPTRQTPDFIRWSAPNGYIVWIKRLKGDDLKDNPFNAYSSDDVGTVRIAVEQEIHDSENDNGSHVH